MTPLTLPGDAGTALAGASIGVAVATFLVRAVIDFLSARRVEDEGRAELKEISLSLGGVSVTSSTDGKRKIEEAVEADTKKLENASPQAFTSVAGPSFTGLWDLTQRRIDAYHKIATGQAKASFVSSQFVTYVGFALIVFVGYIAATASTVAGAISAGGVGVIGGGLSAYISATFMRSQAQANAQLREFFLQPVEFARFLAAERLLDDLEDDNKSKTRAALITSIVSKGKTSAKAAPKKVAKKPAAN